MRWAICGCCTLIGTLLLTGAAAGQVATANPLVRLNAPDDPAETHPAFTLFGYKRSVVRNARGVDETYFVRTRANATQSVLTPAQFDPLSRQMGLLVAENPWTTRTWRNCPLLVDFVATKMEAGAEYAGGQDGDTTHPHAWGSRFWAQEPAYPGRDAQGNPYNWGDPLDGTIYVVMELLNASRAAEFQKVWSQSRDAHRQLVAAAAAVNRKQQTWEQNRDRWIYSEAGLKAENLAWAVQIVRENAQGLSLASNLEAGYGRAFQQYARWVDETTQKDGRVDYVRLSETILANRSTFRTNPPDAAESYGSRLARVYSQYLPLR
jgi:hypothetical protein